MSSIYSERLLLVHQVTTGSFVCSPTNTTVLMTAAFFVAGPAGGGQVQLIDQSTDATILWLPAQPQTAGQWLLATDLRIVIPPGIVTLINNNTGFSGGADVLLCGYSLTPP